MTTTSNSTGYAEPPRGARAMAIIRWTLLGLLSVFAITMVLDWAGVIHVHASAVHATVYTCPMHPTYTSDKPGDCPICGMTLVPREGTTAVVAQTPKKGATEAQAETSSVPGVVPITLPSDRIQRIGMRTVTVERRTIGDALSLVGFVTPDESRLTRAQIRVSGWVRRLYVTQTGDPVQRGQPLLALYSPTLFQAEQEYVLVARAADVTEGPRGEMKQKARQRLELLGVPAAEIARLDRTGHPTDELTLTAPASGYVLAKQVLEGQYVDASTPLLTIADLSHVWVLADVYERDLRRVHAGQSVQVSVAAEPGSVFLGHVDYVYPTVSLATRTLKVRVVIANPGLRLRPGMYGDVRILTNPRPSLVIPQEALVQTGANTYVYLALPGGHFAPRPVIAGVQEGGMVEIVSGLTEGERVVTSGNFLIDSESRLRAAIGGGASTMPGMKMDDEPAPAPAPAKRRSGS